MFYVYRVRHDRFRKERQLVKRASHSLELFPKDQPLLKAFGV
jgi:hypothetical protein